MVVWTFRNLITFASSTGQPVYKHNPANSEFSASPRLEFKNDADNYSLKGG